MDNSGDESSSSNPTPPPAEERRRRGGLIVTRVRHPWEHELFAPPPPPPPPVMGDPRQTAFRPYRPPAPLWSFPGPTTAVRIGGSPSRRKRGRDAAAAGGGDVRHHCSVCNKGFGSTKALFGHMRSHPDRGWKGVHPPPAFRAEEEFANIRAAVGGAAAEGEGEVGEGSSYRVPDLNHPPPPDAN